MKKIGILTFHRSLNYGAFMQAYSLYLRICAEFPDDQVEIIDYAAQRMQSKYSYRPIEFILAPLCGIKRKTLIPTLKAVIKNAFFCVGGTRYLENRRLMRAGFERCMKRVALSTPYVCTDDIKTATEYIKSKKYDLVIVGSDCVWEFNNYPFPNVYYLKDVRSSVKMSYAACAQGILYDNLSESQTAYMRESWEQFSYLGVRDRATEELLLSVCEKLNPHHNCDPTIFLNLERLPVSDDEIRKKMEQHGVDFSRPLVCLMANEDVGKVCRQVVGDECQIVAVYEQNRYADCFVPSLTPFEWARCFSFFRIVFTNKFHGTIFALKNGVSVLSFDWAANSSLTKNGETKIKDLYARLGLSEGHYFIGKKHYAAEEISEIKRWYEYHIHNAERDNILESLSREEKSAKAFFERAKDLLGG